MTKDAGQRHNVAADHPEKVAELRALLDRPRQQPRSAPQTSP